MKTYQALTSLPIVGEATERFAVNKIICIGRNYAEHAREMGHDPEKEPPFFFFKPLSALAETHSPFIYPWYSKEVHHEVELVIALNGAGYNLNAAAAQNIIGGFGIGLDMTCRDIQKHAKQQGRPWELAKGFDGSAPCSAIQRGDFQTLQKMGELSLTRNNTLVQQCDWRDMVWSVTELIMEVSRYVHLQAGDLFFTGTPAGVGPVDIGDTLIARLDGFSEELQVDIVAR